MICCYSLKSNKILQTIIAGDGRRILLMIYPAMLRGKQKALTRHSSDKAR